MTTENPDAYLEGRQFYNIKEAARYLGVSYWFIHRRIGTEEGPPFRKMGVCWKIPKDDFIKWANQPVIR